MKSNEIRWHSAPILAIPYITRINKQIDKGLHPPFSQEGWSRNKQELPRYNPYFHSGQDLQCSATQPHWTWNWENSLKEPKWLSKKSIDDIANFDNPSHFRIKNLEATLSFVDFSKAFDFIHRGKMEQILQAYALPKETVAAIMMLYKNTEVKVRSPDGDRDFFDFVASVLKWNTLAPYLFIICLDNLLRTSINIMKK